jgi:4-diphosphocytidyl-2-C-methyl-D-erythritol kinase
MWTERFAPAKVNLFLHVGAAASDGYHPVCSLMVFASVGDTVRLRDAKTMGFAVSGPFAPALQADSDNLVVRARDALWRDLPAAPPPFEIELVKALPIAAGLGGGSADAAAALGLVAARLQAAGLLDRATAEARVAAIARHLGADVTACLAARPVIGLGRGDDLAPAPALPPLPAVLVNPLAPSPTGPVYRAFDAMAQTPRADEPALPTALADVPAVIALLQTTRNDLQAPAAALQPKIAEVLAALAAEPEAAFVRMSGSGATCFALCRDAASANALEARLSRDHPRWWVKACVFGDGAPAA